MQLTVKGVFQTLGTHPLGFTAALRSRLFGLFLLVTFFWLFLHRSGSGQGARCVSHFWRVWMDGVVAFLYLVSCIFYVGFRLLRLRIRHNHALDPWRRWPPVHRMISLEFGACKSRSQLAAARCSRLQATDPFRTIRGIMPIVHSADNVKPLAPVPGAAVLSNPCLDDEYTEPIDHSAANLRHSDGLRHHDARSRHTGNELKRKRRPCSATLQARSWHALGRHIYSGRRRIKRAAEGNRGGRQTLPRGRLPVAPEQGRLPLLGRRRSDLDPKRRQRAGRIPQHPARHHRMEAGHR